MSITRRRFLLGTTAGLILPSFYERAYSFFENHGEPLLIVPKQHDEILYACADYAEYPHLQLSLGHPETPPPEMTILEFCKKYNEGDPETWWRENWLCADEPEPVEMDLAMDEYVVCDWWLRTESPGAKAFHYLQCLDLGPQLAGANAVGGLHFIDGPAPGNDYLAVEASDAVSISLLQQRLNDLGAGIRIELF